RRAFRGDGVCAFKFISLELSFDRDFYLSVRAFDLSFHLSIRDLQRFEIGCLLSILIDPFRRATPLPLLILAQGEGEFVRVSITSAVGADPLAGVFFILRAASLSACAHIFGGDQD